jgi:predicted hydrocarbon binding protein
MSKIKNNPDNTDEFISIYRSQLEHRATWMGLIYDEMIKAGIDAEPVIRRAIKRCGRIHGENIKKRCVNPDDCRDFRNNFLSDVGEKTFAMRPIEAGKDNLKIDFHYCPLISAWQKLGFDDKTCDLLCDMAMDGDRGIAEIMGLKLELSDTIAKGCRECKLLFTK